MNDQSISIVGCGWLGLPLAKRFIQMGYHVKGSTTTHDKMAQLESMGVEAYRIEMDPEVQGAGISQLLESNILFLNIPFRRSLKDPNFYRMQMDSLLQHILNSPVRWVIFASSTSIYPPSAEYADEGMEIRPADERARTLLGVEEMLQEVKKFKTTILRFSGLYGGERKIGKFMSGKKNLSNGGSPVNLVHLQDCIEIITQTILKNLKGEILNVAGDHHPSRRDLYVKAAEFYGAEPPVFADGPATRKKIVSNSKLKRTLQYTFIHPDPMDFERH